MHPQLGQSITELLERCDDRLVVEKEFVLA
jgi:hypothetical protein